MKDELYEVFLWDKAEFEFTADVLPAIFYNDSLKVWRVDLNTSQFLMEAVRRIAEWEEVRAVIPHDDLKLSFASPDGKMQAIQTRGQADLLLLVDGQHTISDAIRMSGSKRFQSLCLLAELLREGAIARTDDASREGGADATSGAVEDGSMLRALRAVRERGGTGIVRVTDGRRSKELAFVKGHPHRTNAWRGDAALATVESARDFGEVMGWKGARWEFLDGTLPPILHSNDDEACAAYRLDPARMIDEIAIAGERWIEIARTVPRDKPLAFAEGDASRANAEKTAALAPLTPQVLALIDGKKTSDDIARLAGKRYDALSAVLALVQSGAVVVVEAKGEEQQEEEWDLSLG
jgi:hypothetical protein